MPATAQQLTVEEIDAFQEHKTIDLAAYKATRVTESSSSFDPIAVTPNGGERMSETPSREEIDAKLDVVTAQTNAKFAELMGEMRTSLATLGGKIDTAKAEINGSIGVVQARVDALPSRWTVVWTIIGTGLTVGTLLAAAVFGAMEYGAQTFANGSVVSQVADAAAKAALAAKR